MSWPNEQPKKHKVIITQDHIQEFGGICLSCGEPADGCEPDARNYECQSCGAMEVCGVAEALMMGIPLDDDVEPDSLFDLM